MAQGKKAAIDIDTLGDKNLDEVSAADFLTALNVGGLALQDLTVWPEKKKVELWLEPENLSKFRLKDIIVRIRVEKKKYELEKFPGFENWRDPRDFQYDDLLNRLTRDIEARLRISK